MFVSSRVAGPRQRSGQGAKHGAVVLEEGRYGVGDGIQRGEATAGELKYSTAWLDRVFGGRRRAGLRRGLTVFMIDGDSGREGTDGSGFADGPGCGGMG